MKVKVKVKSLSRVRLFVTLWTVAYQAPLSMGFSRQEYWSGFLCPSPGDLPDPGIEPRDQIRYPTLEADALTSEPPGKPLGYPKGYFLENILSPRIVSPGIHLQLFRVTLLRFFSTKYPLHFLAPRYFFFFSSALKVRALVYLLCHTLLEAIFASKAMRREDIKGNKQ